MSERFQIELYCEDCDEWVVMEISNNPYPLADGEADALWQMGALMRWTLLSKKGTPRK